jgi:NADPH:quinone reductase
MGERVWLYEAQWHRPFGTAADYVALPSALAVPLPESTSFAQGACLGVPAMTAHRAVFGSGSVRGNTILVTGGAGAVGYYAVQLAKWGGASTVIATVSRPEQAVLAKNVGADCVINYQTVRIQEWLGAERGVDRVVDVDFEANLDISLAVLKNGGVIAAYASSRGNRAATPTIPIYSLLTHNISIQTLLTYTMAESAKQDAIRDINAALAQGALQHNIARRFALNDVAAAHDAIESGKLVGKVVIELEHSL